MQRITRLFTGLLWLCTLFPLASQAQQADTVRQGQTVPGTTTRNYSDEKIWRIGKGIYTDTIRRGDFKASAADVVELDDCDTTFQTFLLVRRPSPWRIGLYLGPNFAYCGTWEGTFGSTYRDRTLYNGTGINFTANVDYYLTRATRRLRFGVGGVIGYQNSFTRSDYKNELYGLGAATTPAIPQSAIEVKSRPSEDAYVLVGPVLTFDFLRSKKKSERTSFIEAGARGGIFRSEAATITGTVPSQNNLLIRSVNPSTTAYHLGALGSLGIFFPVGNYWHLGLQAQGYITRLNYLIINGTNIAGGGASTLYEFSRKNGGFNVGIGARKDFRQKKLIPKAPVTCPVCDSIPALAVRFNNASLLGMSMVNDSLTAPANTMPVISWHTRTLTPRNETFTARLHYKADSTPSVRDSIIAQLVNTTDTTLTFPAAYMENGKPRRGFYYVTVHGRQESKCGTCMSDVATTSFAFLKPNQVAVVTPTPCTFKNRLDRLEVYYRTPYTRDIANVCYCQGQITQVGDTVTRLRYRGLNRRLAMQPFEFTNADGVLNLRELPADLAKMLQDEKRKIESGKAISYKGRRIRPQVSSFRSVFTVEEEPCPANGMKGRTIGSFLVTISDNSYTITDLKPLTEEQRVKMTTPPAPKAPARRGGRSGRRDVGFGVDANN